MTTREQPRTPASTSGDVVLPAKRSRKRWGRGLIAAAVASAALIGAASPAMAASPLDYLVPYVKDAANLSRAYWKAVQPNAGMGGIEVIAMFDTNHPPCLPDNGIGDHPAWACLSERKIAVYMPNLDALAKRTGNAEVTAHLVVGHEFGHFGLVQTGDRDLDESHAMCASGAYLRVVSERAKRFDANTADAASKKALETEAGVNSYKTGWNKGITICSKGW